MLPKEKIHDTAHLLEHTNDEKTVECSDDKLEHPVTDPHRSIIPNDSERGTGKDLLLSVVRNGNRATVVKIDSSARLRSFKSTNRLRWDHAPTMDKPKWSSPAMETN